MTGFFPLCAAAAAALACLAASGPACAVPPPAAKSAPPAAAAQPQASGGHEALAAALPPGPAREAARRLVQPYAQATATALGTPAWDGTEAGLRALATAHAADLALVDGQLLAALCRSAVLDRLDWSAAGVSRDRYVPGAASDCGAGAYADATVLAWDGGKAPAGAAPYGWTDFWDVAKHPGRRGLRRAARGNLEIALLADGVAAGDIYRTLRGSDGVDRAFRKLDQLKPYIEWYGEPAEAAQFLSTAKVLMTSAQAATLRLVTHAHPAHQMAGSLGEVWSWARPAGAPHAEAARLALAIAADSARQAILARETGYTPATRDGASLAGMELPAVMIDEQYWAENGAKLEARFAEWVKK